MAFIIRLAIFLFSLSAFSLSAQTRSRANATLVHEDEELLVFNKEDGRGFEIVSTVDGMPEVLGYSDTGYFDPDNIPPAMKFWMEMMKGNCKAVKNGARFPFSAITRAERTDIKPLLGSLSWGQEEPYNYKCPVDNGKLSITGCSATATAMIVKYYQYASGKDSVDYVTDTNRMLVRYNFAERLPKLDWANMIDAYSCESKLVQGEELDKDLTSYLVYTNIKAVGNSKGIAIEVDTFINISIRTAIEGTAQFLLFDKNGEFISPFGESFDINFTAGDGYTYKTMHITLPESLADGTYTTTLGFKSKTEDKWALARHIRYPSKILNPLYLPIEKKGTTITVGDYACHTSYSETQASAVAELMLACGASTQMDYGKDASSARMDYTVSGLCEHLGYDSDMYVCGSNFMDIETGHNELINELSEGRPVLIFGLSKSGDGHAFIADGVRFSAMGSPTFHINWGWDGNVNGYFLLSKLEPIEQASHIWNYSHEYYLSCGIKPEDGKSGAKAIAYEKFSCDKSEVTVGEDIVLTLDSMLTIMPKKYETETPVAFTVDAKGKETKLGEFKTIRNVNPFEYNKTPYTLNLTVPTSLESGTYNIIVRLKGPDNTFGKYFTSCKVTLQVTNPTAIESITQDENKTGISYDLNGRIATGKSGLVIENGRKKIIRNDGI